MPIKNGLETTKIIRRYEKSKNLPSAYIIAYTGHQEKNNSYKEHGINDIIQKPLKV